jgi:hypothetical protein
VAHYGPVRRVLYLALSAVTALTLAACDTGKNAPTALRCGTVNLSCRVDSATTTTAHEQSRLIIIVEPHDGDRVSQAWVDTQLVNSRLCRDGSTLSWTENGYWSSTDDVFHARPGTNEITGPPKLVHKCSPAQP